MIILSGIGLMPKTCLLELAGGFQTVGKGPGLGLEMFSNHVTYSEVAIVTLCKQNNMVV